MKNVSILIKPASSLCNLRCRYCFYADVADHREVKSMGIMLPETAEALIQSAFSAADPGAAVSFAFQGGEPTLAGLDYFTNFVSLVQMHRPDRIQVSYAIQTNGMTIDETWADFFRAHHFLVGISIDGDKALHNFNRVDGKADGTYTRATQALTLLQKKQVDVNALCVVTGTCARHPQRIYANLKKLNIQYIQFIPCLDPLGEDRGVSPYSLRPDAYGGFLCRLFDAWYRDWEAGQYVSIRLFDDYIHLAMGMPSGTCATSGSCGGYLVAEGDGSLYPCDFYVLDEWKLGNIRDGSLEHFAACDKQREFMEGSCRKPDECAQCQWFRLCQGGCKRDWEQRDGAPHNYYCSAFKRFFEYAASRIAYIARMEAQMRAQMGR